MLSCAGELEQTGLLGTGAVLGLLAEPGALIGLGISEYEAKRYEGKIRRECLDFCPYG